MAFNAAKAIQDAAMGLPAAVDTTVAAAPIPSPGTPRPRFDADEAIRAAASGSASSVGAIAPPPLTAPASDPEPTSSLSGLAANVKARFSPIGAPKVGATDQPWATNYNSDHPSPDDLVEHDPYAAAKWQKAVAADNVRNPAMPWIGNIPLLTNESHIAADAMTDRMNLHPEGTFGEAAANTANTLLHALPSFIKTGGEVGAGAMFAPVDLMNRGLKAVGVPDKYNKILGDIPRDAILNGTAAAQGLVHMPAYSLGATMGNVMNPAAAASNPLQSTMELAGALSPAMGGLGAARALGAPSALAPDAGMLAKAGEATARTFQGAAKGLGGMDEWDAVNPATGAPTRPLANMAANTLKAAKDALSEGEYGTAAKLGVKGAAQGALPFLADQAVGGPTNAVNAPVWGLRAIGEGMKLNPYFRAGLSTAEEKNTLATKTFEKMAGPDAVEAGEAAAAATPEGVKPRPILDAKTDWAQDVAGVQAEHAGTVADAKGVRALAQAEADKAWKDSAVAAKVKYNDIVGEGRGASLEQRAAAMAEFKAALEDAKAQRNAAWVKASDAFDSWHEGAKGTLTDDVAAAAARRDQRIKDEKQAGWNARDASHAEGVFTDNNPLPGFEDVHPGDAPMPPTSTLAQASRGLRDQLVSPLNRQFGTAAPGPNGEPMLRFTPKSGDLVDAAGQTFKGASHDPETGLFEVPGKGLLTADQMRTEFPNADLGRMEGATIPAGDVRGMLNNNAGGRIRLLGQDGKPVGDFPIGMRGALEPDVRARLVRAYYQNPNASVDFDLTAPTGEPVHPRAADAANAIAVLTTKATLEGVRAARLPPSVADQLLQHLPHERLFSDKYDLPGPNDYPEGVQSALDVMTAERKGTSTYHNSDENTIPVARAQLHQQIGNIAVLNQAGKWLEASVVRALAPEVKAGIDAARGEYEGAFQTAREKYADTMAQARQSLWEAWAAAQKERIGSKATAIATKAADQAEAAVTGSDALAAAREAYYRIKDEAQTALRDAQHEASVSYSNQIKAAQQDRSAAMRDLGYRPIDTSHMSSEGRALVEHWAGLGARDSKGVGLKSAIELPTSIAENIESLLDNKGRGWTRVLPDNWIGRGVQKLHSSYVTAQLMVLPTSALNNTLSNFTQALPVVLKEGLWDYPANLLKATSDYFGIQGKPDMLRYWEGPKNAAKRTLGMESAPEAQARPFLWNPNDMVTLRPGLTMKRGDIVQAFGGESAYGLESPKGSAAPGPLQGILRDKGGKAGGAVADVLGKTKEGFHDWIDWNREQYGQGALSDMAAKEAMLKSYLTKHPEATLEQGVAVAERNLLAYHKMPDLPRQLSSTFIPFFNWTWGATPVIHRMLGDFPAMFNGFMLANDQVEQEKALRDHVDIKDMARRMPAYMQNQDYNGPGSTPGTYSLEDLSRKAPATGVTTGVTDFVLGGRGIADTARGGVKGSITPLLAGPVNALEIALHPDEAKDFGTDKQILREGAGPAEKIYEAAKAVALPFVLPSGGMRFAEDVVKHMAGYTPKYASGAPRPWADTIRRGLVGSTESTVDPDALRVRTGKGLNNRLTAMVKELEAQTKDITERNNLTDTEKAQAKSALAAKFRESPELKQIREEFARAVSGSLSKYPRLRRPLTGASDAGTPLQVNIPDDLKEAGESLDKLLLP